MGVEISKAQQNSGDVGSSSYAQNGGTVVREPYPRTTPLSSGPALSASGVMLSVAVPLYAGDVINKIAFRTGSGGFTTITNHWFALYDDQATPALLAQTSDNGSTAWAATTTRELTLQSTITIVRTGLYYAAICAVYTGSPTIVGTSTTTQATPANLMFTGQKILAGTSGSSLTATAPATISSPSAVASIPYCTMRA